MLISTILLYLAAALLAGVGTVVVRRHGARPIAVFLWSSLVFANVFFLLPVGFGEGPHRSAIRSSPAP